MNDPLSPSHKSEYARPSASEGVRPKAELEPDLICQVKTCFKPNKFNGWCDIHRAQAKKEGLDVSFKQCKVDKCESRVNARGYCATHYKKARRNGEFGPVPECSLDGCNKSVYSLGLCEAHYKRDRMKTETRLCNEEGCNRKLYAVGKCAYHRAVARHKDNPCSFEGCTTGQFSKGYCQAHYVQSMAGKELKPKRRYIYVGDNPESIVCKLCERDLPASNYYIYKQKNNQYYSRCKECTIATAALSRYKGGRQKEFPLKASQYLKSQGISPGQFYLD